MSDRDVSQVAHLLVKRFGAKAGGVAAGRVAAKFTLGDLVLLSQKVAV
jgi:hypothetical protein